MHFDIKIQAAFAKAAPNFGIDLGGPRHMSGADVALDSFVGVVDPTHVAMGTESSQQSFSQP